MVDEIDFMLRLIPSAWEGIGASDVVLDWIRRGVDIPFWNIPDPFYFKNKQFTLKERLFIRSELKQLLKVGSIKIVQHSDFISPISCVPKKNGKLRLIIDLRHLNSCVKSRRFKYEDITSVTELIEPGDQLITVDLRDGFHHIPLAHCAQEYLGFVFEGVTYTWCVLPFGLSCSPYFSVKL